MPIREAEIAAMLTANYEAALKLIPPDMIEEFRRKILRPDDFTAYAKPILVAIEFKDIAAETRIQNWIADRFKKGNFGRKLVAANADPIKVYERLIEGVFGKRYR
jgi:hypothetical protein